MRRQRRFGALNERQFEHIKVAIGQLCDRMQATNTLTLSHEQLINLTAPEQDRRFLLESHKIADISGVREGLDLHISDVRVHFEMYKVPGFKKLPLVPVSPAIQPDADPALVSAFHIWTNRRLEIGRDFGRVKAVFEHLIVKCQTPEALRFIWPSIVPLCRLTEYTMPLADKLAELKVPGALPTLNPSIKEACRKTAGTIAQALLLPSDLKEPQKPAVRVWMVSRPSYNENGFIFASL